MHSPILFIYTHILSAITIPLDSYLTSKYLYIPFFK